MIIATAGHVDHGKTALIKALTGADTDRLPEEKARGLSIEPGFAYQALPNNKTLGFVDVPGHEKFIRNMLAGVSGIDLGLLVVAADDGVMPQTREHFAILNLLGIEQYVVALSKIDRVDDRRIEEVRNEITQLFKQAGHRDMALFPVCAPGKQGIAPLKKALVERAQTMNNRVVGGHFRMAIDRVFSLKGVGLIVTGMVFSGATQIDDRLILSADGSVVRVRGIKVHNTASDLAQAGERCALNISGRSVSTNSVQRGGWLLHESLLVPTRRIDVDLRVLATEPKLLKHWTPGHLHIGAAHFAARMAVLGGSSIAAGEQALVQLVLEQDAFVVQGDRFVLRDQSAQRTMAGGHVVDPFSPRRGRARPDRIQTLRLMNRSDPGEALNALAQISQSGVALTPFTLAYNLQQQQVDHIIAAHSLIRVGRQAQAWIFTTLQWQRLLRHIEQMITSFHQDKPQLAGATLRDIQLALKPYIETPVLKEATELLVQTKRLVQRATLFHLPVHVIKISEQDQQLWVRAAPYLAPNSGSPLSLEQAAQALVIDKAALAASLQNAVNAGEMVWVTKNRCLPLTYLIRLGFAAEALAGRTTQDSFTVTEYCKHIQTGRNFAVNLLEYFDHIGLTVRVANRRCIRRPAATVFGVNEAC